MNEQVRLFIYVFASLAVMAGVLDGQSRRRAPASYVQPSAPNEEEGRAILEQSRNIGLAGPYFLEFDLLIRPRVGDERRLSGRWFGSRNVTGLVTRIELALEGGGFETWLIQGGANPAIWVARNESKGTLVEGPAVMEPLGGTTISPADLQVPFMHWSEHVYEGLARFRGRPTHVFLLYPPEVEADPYAGYGGARVFIDTAYSAISQAQWVSPDGEPIKTITVLGLKKVDEVWIVKSFEVRDDETRAKTRFKVTAAALNVAFPESFFSPSGSFEPTPVAISEEKLVRLD